MVLVVTASGWRKTCATIPTFTGYNLDGGFAEYTLADERFCFLLSPAYSRPGKQPRFLCAGLIGYRADRMTGEKVRTLGIYGFGGGLLISLLRWQGMRAGKFLLSPVRVT